MSHTFFINWNDVPAHELAPGVRIRTPHGQNIMLSLLEMAAGTEVPTHSHPHEQAGILLEGRMQLTLGDETRVIDAGQAYLIPPDTPHRAVPVGGPIKALDVFSPVREDYAKRLDQYIFRDKME